MRIPTAWGAVASETDWETSDFNRYGHLAIESGQRYAHAQAEWARWAAAQVGELETDETRAPAR
jgi:hypothetical protein